QTVHEQGVRFGSRHHLGVYAPVGKGSPPGFVLVLVTHAGPDVSSNEVGVGARLVRVGENFVMIGVDVLNAGLFKRVTLWTGDVHSEVKQVGRLQPGVRHIV